MIICFILSVYSLHSLIKHIRISRLKNVNSIYFRSRIYVEGKVDYGEYTDKNNVRRQATTIIAGKKCVTTAIPSPSPSLKAWLCYK